MLLYELLFRDLLISKGFKAEYVGDVGSIGYDLIVNDKLRVELKSYHSEGFSARRNSCNGTTYIEKLDFLIVIQCWNDDITYWIFPESWAKDDDIFRKPYYENDIKKYRNNFNLLSEKLAKLKLRNKISRQSAMRTGEKNTIRIREERRKEVEVYLKELKENNGKFNATKEVVR